MRTAIGHLDEFSLGERTIENTAPRSGLTDVVSRVETPRKTTEDAPNVPTRDKRAPQLTLIKGQLAVPVVRTLCDLGVVVEQVEGQRVILARELFELSQLFAGFCHPVQHLVPVVRAQLLGLNRQAGPATGGIPYEDEEVGTPPMLLMFRSLVERKAPSVAVCKHVQHKEIGQRFFAETGPEVLGKKQRRPCAVRDAFSRSHVRCQEDGKQSAHGSSSSAWPPSPPPPSPRTTLSPPSATAPKPPPPRDAACHHPLPFLTTQPFSRATFRAPTTE